ncbi:unnamed protein product [Somion occarium]|uniref:F-box domain-containing protein n=1 Tax=Somion occarium TaxID=3059160 RepID=A0ABP1DP12_9APHY
MPPLRRSRRLALRAEALIVKPLNFPSELQDMILDQLSDAVSLRSCARINKHWSTAARPHIFRVIRLDSWSRLAELTEIVMSDRIIANYIREVRLRGSIEVEADARKKQDDDWWIYQFPYMLGGHLKCLKTIELSHFYRSTNIYDEERRTEEQEKFATWVYSLRTLKRVENLSMKKCMMSSNALTAFMRSFQRLIRIELCDVFVDNSGDPDAISIPRVDGTEAREAYVEDAGLSGSAEPTVLFPLSYPEPRLRGLDVDQDDASTFAPFNFDYQSGWLLPRHIVSSLKALVFGGKIEVVPFTRFISDLCPCPSVEYVGCSIYELDFLSGIDLSGFPNLNRLWFNLGFFKNTTVAICSILSRLRGSHLKDIICVVELEELDDLASNVVTPLDSLLCSDEFKELESMEVVHLCYHAPRKVRQAGLKAFPGLSKRGVLKFRHHPVP